MLRNCKDLGSYCDSFMHAFPKLQFPVRFASARQAVLSGLFFFFAFRL